MVTTTRFRIIIAFFRALALHMGAHHKGLEKKATELRNELENHTGRSFTQGVFIDDIPAIEIFFEVAVNVYSLNENGHAEIVYLSKLSYSPMHLNLFKNHFSYIKKMKTFAKRFDCQMCDRIFNRVTHLNLTCKNLQYRNERDLPWWEVSKRSYTFRTT